MKRSDIPVLDDFRAFDAVARHGSVRAAADELHLTHSAVSRRVSKLAASLEAELIEPAGRGIQLTRSGERLAEATAEALGILGSAIKSIRAPDAPASLLLSCERSVAMRWLIPRLSDFQDQHPDLPLNLSVEGGNLNFEREEVSLAIRRLDFPLQPNWEVTRLCAEETGPVLAPALSARYSSGDFIGLATKTRPDAWQEWLANHPDSPRPREIRSYDHHFLMVEAAASGLGVALSPKILSVDDIERGRLIAPCGFSPDSTWYGLIDRGGNGPDHDQKQKLAAWLINEFKSI